LKDACTETSHDEPDCQTAVDTVVLSPDCIDTDRQLQQQQHSYAASISSDSSPVDLMSSFGSDKLHLELATSSCDGLSDKEDVVRAVRDRISDITGCPQQNDSAANEEASCSRLLSVALTTNNDYFREIY
jgi:hypothetical protein